MAQFDDGNVSSHSSDLDSQVVRGISNTPNGNNKRCMSPTDHRRQRLRMIPESNQEDDVSSLTSYRSNSTISNTATRPLNDQNHNNRNSPSPSLSNMPSPSVSTNVSNLLSMHMPPIVIGQGQGQNQNVVDNMYVNEEVMIIDQSQNTRDDNGQSQEDLDVYTEYDNNQRLMKEKIGADKPFCVAKKSFEIGDIVIPKWTLAEIQENKNEDQDADVILSGDADNVYTLKFAKPLGHAMFNLHEHKLKNFFSFSMFVSFSLYARV